MKTSHLANMGLGEALLTDWMNLKLRGSMQINPLPSTLEMLTNATTPRVLAAKAARGTRRILKGIDTICS